MNFHKEDPETRIQIQGCETGREESQEITCMSALLPGQLRIKPSRDLGNATPPRGKTVMVFIHQILSVTVPQPCHCRSDPEIERSRDPWTSQGRIFRRSSEQAEGIEAANWALTVSTCTWYGVWYLADAWCLFKKWRKERRMEGKWMIQTELKCQPWQHVASNKDRSKIKGSF